MEEGDGDANDKNDGLRHIDPLCHVISVLVMIGSWNFGSRDKVLLLGGEAVTLASI